MVMGGKKSRNKGANFERAIAKRLREWLGDDWTVKRNPTDRQKGKAGAGEFEIVGPLPFPFAIECKAHESFDYGQLFRTPLTGPFVGFWEQAKAQAEAAEKRPLLFIKKNNGPVIAVLGSDSIADIRPVTEYGRQLRIYHMDCYVIEAASFFATYPSMLYEIGRSG